MNMDFCKGFENWGCKEMKVTSCHNMIQHCCFAKDTCITLADGSKKEAQHMYMGDVVKNSDGRAVVIKNIYLGYEECICHITTEGAKSINLSNDHPIDTEMGLLPAQSVTVGMNIRTENGLERISAISLISYGGDVYNFSFDNQEIIIGNGIFIGDFEHQNSILKRVEAED